LERITAMAYAMVVDYGMSEKVGYVSFNLSGRDDQRMMFDKPYSDTTALLIDEEVKRLIDDVRERAQRMLTERRGQLNALAQALLEREVLGPKDLVEILGPRPHGEYVDVAGDGSPPTVIQAPVPDTPPIGPGDDPRPSMP
ncbi:MAG TPA: AAA family ATPase, partial [Rhodothermales bacterium]|nr:AAA family ATPase [Rhodothermales bacterium]